jgi:hypothetical protein
MNWVSEASVGVTAVAAIVVVVKAFLALVGNHLKHSAEKSQELTRAIILMTERIERCPHHDQHTAQGS